MPDVRVFTRDELYDRIWSDPMWKVAPQLGLSDRGLPKICEKHRIPRPGRGYWQKLKHGKEPQKPALPALAEDEQALERITIRTGPEPEGTDPSPGPVEEQKAFESRSENRITVAGPLEDPHPLVERTREAFKSGGNPKSGSDASPLDIHVEPQTLHRALRIMDALLKALDERELPVRISDDDQAKTLVEVRGVELPIQIEEVYRRVEVPPGELSEWRASIYGEDEIPPQYDNEPTGELALKINVSSFDAPRVRKTWADGKTQRVEELLNSFVVGLVRAAEVKKRRDREREARRKRREEESRLREERRQRAQEERRRREDLAKRAEEWAEHRRIREFVAAVRKAGELRSLLGPGSEPSGWLEWAEQHVAETDPFRELSDLRLRQDGRSRIYVPGGS